MASTYQRAKDGLPTLEVKHFARQGGGLILNGTSGTSEAIYLIQRSSDGLDLQICLLYTSDAADERSSVDLGGRRIIKKKTRKWT